MEESALLPDDVDGRILLEKATAKWCALQKGRSIDVLPSGFGDIVGTDKELKEHYEVMKKNPEMEHDDPNMVTVAPGKTGEIIWQFTKAGKVDFACLQSGHYDAGMKGLVKVASGRSVANSGGHKH